MLSRLRHDYAVEITALTQKHIRKFLSVDTIQSLHVQMQIKAHTNRETGSRNTAGFLRLKRT